MLRSAMTIKMGLVGFFLIILILSLNEMLRWKSVKTFASTSYEQGQNQQLQLVDDANTITCRSNVIVQLVVVACESNSKKTLQETLNMIKSAVLFTNCPLQVHIFTTNLEEKLQTQIASWPQAMIEKFALKIHSLVYPLSPEETDEMMNWWGPCASFRLFLTDVLSDIDAILYVDTDVIFLGAIEEIWDHFDKFDSWQVGALAPRVGWNFKVRQENKNYVQMPNGQMTQINSGVFLMNLTKMRTPVFKTSNEITNSLQSWNRQLLFPIYRLNIKDMYGDQNLINMIFHYNPELLYFLPCRYNYQHKFCFDGYSERFCDSAEEQGAFLIHGSANTFYNSYAPAFRIINEVFIKYDFEKNLKGSLLDRTLQQLNELSSEFHCSNKTRVFTKTLRKSIESIEKRTNF